MCFRPIYCLPFFLDFCLYEYFFCLFVAAIERLPPIRANIAASTRTAATASLVPCDMALFTCCGTITVDITTGAMVLDGFGCWNGAVGLTPTCISAIIGSAGTENVTVHAVEFTLKGFISFHVPLTSMYGVTLLNWQLYLTVTFMFV